MNELNINWNNIKKKSPRAFNEFHDLVALQGFSFAGGKFWLDDVDVDDHGRSNNITIKAGDLAMIGYILEFCYDKQIAGITRKEDVIEKAFYLIECGYDPADESEKAVAECKTRMINRKW
jgi:hypothetical protein